MTIYFPHLLTLGSAIENLLVCNAPKKLVSSQKSGLPLNQGKESAAFALFLCLHKSVASTNLNYRLNEITLIGFRD